MRRRGFTLIECIIATFILAIGFMAVASTYPLSYRSAAVSTNHVLAMQVASGMLETVRDNPYGTTPSLQPVTLSMVVGASGSTGATVPVVTTSASPSATPSTVTFYPSVKFARGGSVPNPNAMSDVCTVTVTWNEPTGRGASLLQKSVSVTGGITREP